MTQNINKFGVQDIWSVFKKNLILILIFSFFSCTIFGFITCKKIINIFSNSNSIENNSQIYVSSIDFYVEPSTEILSNENSNFCRAIPDDIIALLNSDICANYICEKLLNLHTKEYILNNTNIILNKNNINKIITIDDIKNLYACKREKNTMLIKLSSFAYDKKLAQDVLDFCREYTNLKLKKVMKYAQIHESKSTTKLINTEELLSENYVDINFKQQNNSSKKNILKIIIKYFVLPVIVLIFLLIFGLCLISYFNPNLNRMSDFCEYDVPVLGEIKK